jgi:acyl-CoA reductase-like NAD-dependent aldehyde dehydrogenase
MRDYTRAYIDGAWVAPAGGEVLDVINPATEQSAGQITLATRRRLLQRDYAGAGALRPQNQLAAAAARRASTIRFLPWQPARRSKKSPLHARALARTMSAPRLPDTSGPAASKSAMGSSMPHSRAGPSNASRSEAG